MNSNGRAVGVATVIAASDDEAAIRQARRLTGRLGVELWHGGRLVIWLRPDPVSPVDLAVR